MKFLQKISNSNLNKLNNEIYSLNPNIIEWYKEKSKLILNYCIDDGKKVKYKINITNWLNKKIIITLLLWDISNSFFSNIKLKNNNNWENLDIIFKKLKDTYNLTWEDALKWILSYMAVSSNKNRNKLIVKWKLESYDKVFHFITSSVLSNEIWKYPTLILWWSKEIYDSLKKVIKYKLTEVGLLDEQSLLNYFDSKKDIIYDCIWDMKANIWWVHLISTNSINNENFSFENYFKKII
jgi:hypothetical protein